MHTRTLTLLTATGVALLAPAGARAAREPSTSHHGAAHHATSGHHAHYSKHVHHAARTRVIHVGSSTGGAGGGASTGTTGGRDGEGIEATDTPTAVILSFQSEILKLKLSDGTVLRGKVTKATEITCATPPIEEEPGEEGGEDAGEGEEAAVEGVSEEVPGEQEEGAEQPETCSTARLIAGADVERAELTVGPHGSTWTRLELSY